jgi:hypothetical protein
MTNMKSEETDPGQRRIRFREKSPDNAHQRIEEEKATGRCPVWFLELQSNPDQEAKMQALPTATKERLLARL